MTISKSRLKAKALEIFRQLEEEGGEVIVTDHGKPALVIRPVEQTVHELFPVTGSETAGLDTLNEPTEAEWGEL